MSEQEFKQARMSDAARHREILRLSSTLSSTPRSWFHLGHAGDIYLVNQRHGQPASGHVKLSRAEFERFVKFYEKAEDSCGRGRIGSSTTSRRKTHKG